MLSNQGILRCEFNRLYKPKRFWVSGCSIEAEEITVTELVDGVGSLSHAESSFNTRELAPKLTLYLIAIFSFVLIILRSEAEHQPDSDRAHLTYRLQGRGVGSA